MATTGDKENKSQSQQSSRPQAKSDQKQDRGQSAQNGRVPIAKAMRLAAGQLSELLQCEPGSVSSVKATDEGWTADVEVVEIERVPDTTSVMGSYRVQLDGDGNLLGYERTRRYARGQIDQRK
ncbi:gas vesicle protein [Streptomyces abyssalis]|uniref:Gas vesicle protein n=1 Tax=Streptomyces abyssalis TaxID=933944 RepID=A0A1E7JUT3_9ACTN|nr:gas vesicle protein [Streptomyces abyssalis]OEU89324.1 gas vesicle protein [Streptomyces abyssalis]OEU93703.1 gas vesicle protein [Streptomyces abyssalis]OEV30348.1 gas vesicle protein [Streptomyces nanshensis]